MNNFISKSKDCHLEYCCTVVQLDDIISIPGATNVVKTIVNGREIVIDKSHQKGDIMIYASNESQLNEDFLSINNLFEDISHNRNQEEVESWLLEHSDISEEEKKSYLQSHRGYFDKHGRVRMKKLCKTVSMGFLFEPQLLLNWDPNLNIMDWSTYVGVDFDTVGTELLVKAYVPEQKQLRNYSSNKRNKKLHKYNRLIPGQFAFHYDTQQFERNIDLFNPEDKVDISVKLHGTSAIIGNLLVKTPKWSGLYEKIFVYLPKWLQFTKQKYDILCSSRSVIINSTINPNKGIGFANGQVQSNIQSWANKLGSLIPQGYTIYGEIIGYYEGTNSFIQKVGNGYDYGCKPGTNRLMIYRVTITDEFGNKKELNISDVIKFTNELKAKLPVTISSGLHVINVIYQGTLHNLYPDISIDENWHSNILQAIKNEKRFFMEQNEPLCKLNVPREGIVIRKTDDLIPEAFKLKSLKFLGKEAEAIDKGEIDVELAQSNY